MRTAIEIARELLAQSDWDYDLIKAEAEALADYDMDALEAAVRSKDYKSLPPMPHVRKKGGKWCILR
mgnify:CR=1 FL=1